MGEQKNLLLAILASLVVLLGFQLLFPAEKIPQNNTVQESESSFTPSPEVITEMPKARNEIISESERIKINNQYIDAGAKIVDKAEDIFNDSEMIVKVKEPLNKEIKMIKENQIVFTYLHLAAAKELTDGLVKSKSICIAYETVTDSNGRLPLLLSLIHISEPTRPY